MAIAVLVIGMVALVLGGQGVIRLLIDHTNTGLVGWMPGGFVGALVADLVLVVVGIGLAAWGDARRRKSAG